MKKFRLGKVVALLLVAALLLGSFGLTGHHIVFAAENEVEAVEETTDEMIDQNEEEVIVESPVAGETSEDESPADEAVTEDEDSSDDGTIQEASEDKTVDVGSRAFMKSANTNNSTTATVDNTADDLAADTAADGTEEDNDNEVVSEEDTMPAQTFSGEGAGLTYTATAPEGALPADSSMSVTAVEGVDTNVAELISEGVVQIQGFRIEFKDKDDNVVNPEIPVSVTITTDVATASEKFALIEVDSTGNDHILDAGQSGKNVSFSADESTTYIAVAYATSYSVAYYADAEDTTPYAVETYDINGTETIGNLPAAPTKQGAIFQGWFVLHEDGSLGEQVTNETVVTANMKVVASYSDLTQVKFVMNNGTDETVISLYERQEGETIGNMPENPFREGYVFVKWVDQADMTTEITAETEVPEGGLTAVAVFEEVHRYDITVKYYYMVGTQRVDFEEEVFEIQEQDAPYTIIPPASTKVSEEYISDTPIYYPNQPSVQITTADLEAAAGNVMREAGRGP